MKGKVKINGVTYTVIVDPSQLGSVVKREDLKKKNKIMTNYLK